MVLAEKDGPDEMSVSQILELDSWLWIFLDTLSTAEDCPLIEKHHCFSGVASCWSLREVDSKLRGRVLISAA